MASREADGTAGTLSMGNGGGEIRGGRCEAAATGRKIVYEKRLTVQIELAGDESVTTMELLKCIRELCGGVIACRSIGVRKYEITMSNEIGKGRLLDGFKIGATMVTGRELSNDELVVSFVGLPAYITDEEIVEKLDGWGVSATSPIKRRMWPGTRIADGTRFLKVKFNDIIQSLPYSAKFNTAMGPEYFRVIHDRQVRVCRLCIQPGHVVRDCPEFCCHRCGVQGHYARECSRARERCELCHNDMDNCVCNESDGNEDFDEDSGSVPEETEGEEETGGSVADMEYAIEADVAVEKCGGPRRSNVGGDGAQECVERQKDMETRVATGKSGLKDGKVESGTDGGAAAAVRPGKPVQAAAARDGGGSLSGSVRSVESSVQQLTDSDLDVDVAQVTQVRKRQSTEKQSKTGKRSREKRLM